MENKTSPISASSLFLPQRGKFPPPIVSSAPTDPRAKAIKPAELIDRRYLAEMEKSGFFDKVWSEKK